MIDETESAVGFLRMGIRAFDLEMQGVHAQQPALLFNKCQRLLADALAAMALFDVNLIEKGVATMIFQAESQRQYHITRSFGFILNEPNLAHGSIV